MIVEVPVAVDPSPRLKIYDSPMSYRWSEEAALDAELSSALGHELIWAIRPLMSFGRFSSDHQAEPTRSPWKVRLSRARTHGRLTPTAIASRFVEELRRNSVSRSYRFSASMRDGVLRLWTTENHRRALFGLKSPEGTNAIVAPPRETRLLDDTLLESVLTHKATASLDAKKLLLAASQAASIKQRLHQLIGETVPKVVVTASTEHPFCRLSVSVGRDLGVPSVYIPHAPTALNRNYADIPHDCALLRGSVDYNYYTSLGARPSSLSVVGDQSFALRSPEVAVSGPVVVLATTAGASVVGLNQALSVLEKSGIHEFAQVTISPHPAARDRAVAVAKEFGVSVAPSGSRTLQILSEHNVILLLVEAPSGVSLEALALGVPVLCLSENRNYLFEEELNVRSVSSLDELERILRGLANSSARLEVARHDVSPFIAATGEEAAMAIEEALSRPHSTTPHGALDSWRTRAP